mmetsp:Transcript_89161/g.277178  ORF Transcript_89161/g.277178 Transcript_89161/m.277178 type:complete len:380 (+) Transcript_89161:913-2052(+)
MDSSIMICICCTADSSVQRPWRMMSTHAPMEGVRVVKGAAVLASPSCTMGVSSMPSISPAHLAAPAANALPCFFCIWSCSFLISFFSRPMTDFIAPIWPMKPTSSPRCLRAASSSSTHWVCRDMRSRRFRASSSFAFLESACARCIASFLCSPSASSASSTAFASGASRSTLALPKPLRSARPTSASLRAPTSLPPSPHIRQFAFSLFRTAWMTCSFCQGDIRAKMRTACKAFSMTSASGPCRDSSRARPVTTRSCSRLKLATSFASKATGGSLLLPVDMAGAHSSPPSSFSERMSALLDSKRAMQTSCATLNAVRGASPVSITQVCFELSRALMTSIESFLVSHLKAMKPAKVISVSAASRGFCMNSRVSCWLLLRHR